MYYMGSTLPSTAILCVMDYLMENGMKTASAFHKDVSGCRFLRVVVCLGCHLNTKEIHRARSSAIVFALHLYPYLYTGTYHATLCRPVPNLALINHKHLF